MAKGRRKPRSIHAARENRSFAGTFVTATLAAALLGSLLLVDTRAESAFDAPKRLAAMLGVALAAATVVAARPRDQPAVSKAHRAAAALFAGAMISALFSALFSPRWAIALDSFRAVALFATLPLIGASALLLSHHWRLLVTCFVGGAAINAAMSIGQAAGFLHPFQYATTGGRANTSALIGNDGLLALVASIAAIVMVDVLFRAGNWQRRSWVGAMAAAFIITMVVNRNLTAMIAAIVGVTAVVISRLGWRRTAGPLAGSIVILAAAVALFGAGRNRVIEVAHNMAASHWNALLSFRGAAWAAALEMIVARPLGWGAGTFPAEFVPHLIKAELTFHQRLTNPFLVGAYYEAHCDYLQGCAELGIAAVLLALASVSITTVSLWRTRRENPEAPLLLGVILSSAVAALAWFPLQRPATSLVVLLAIGRAWRGSAGGSKEAAQ